MHRLQLVTHEGEHEAQGWSVRGQTRMSTRETGNWGVGANSVLDLGAIKVPACYFANAFEERGFSLKTPLTWYPPVGRHLCLSRGYLFHVQVYEKQSPGLDRLG